MSDGEQELTGRYLVFLEPGLEVAGGVKLIGNSYLLGDSREELEQFIRVWLGREDLIGKIEAERYVSWRCVPPRERSG